MITVLWWMGQNTITTAVMVLFVAAAGRLFRNRPAVQHVLWVVVLLKFVTPPLVSWPWSVQNVIGQSLRALVAPGTDSVVSPPREHPAIVVNAVPNQGEDGGVTGERRRPLTSVFSDLAARATRPAGVAPENGKSTRVALELVLGIWLVGGALFAARQFRRIVGHASLVRRGSTAPEQLTVEVEAMARQVGLRPPQALIARGILSPFVWFLGRLRLVWPETMLSCDEIVRARGVIAHELAHVRRGDHWVAWLELVAGLVWWWNPLFWFVRRRIRATAEMACDAIALSTCPGHRRAYAELLLELSAGPKTGALAPVLGVSASTPSSFERRLSMILSDRVSGKVSAWGLLTAGLLALAALPGWSWAQQQPSRAGASSGVVNEGTLVNEGALIEMLNRFEAPIIEQPVADADLGAIIEKLQFVVAQGPPPEDQDTTAARLERLEGAIQRLSQLLEPPPQGGPKPRFVPDRLPQDASAPVLKPGGPTDAAAPVVIVGRGRIYVLTGVKNGAYLTALNKDGQQIWLSHFPAPVPIRGDGVEWILEEPKDKKQVVVTWTRPNERIRFLFDTNTGRVLAEGVVPSPKSTDLGFPVKRQDTELPSARLERLEKSVDDLRKQLQDSAQAHKSSLLAALQAREVAKEEAVNASEKWRYLSRQRVKALEARQEAVNASEATGRARSTDNLKLLMLGLHGYHDVNAHFPPAALHDKDGKPLLSWRVLILPYLQQEELFKQFKLDEPWDSEHNKKLLAKMPEVYAPSRGKMKEKYSTFYQVFTGEGTAFEGVRGLPLTDIPDGTATTIAIVEAGETVPWTKPADLPFDPNQALPTLGGLFENVFHAAFCDGSVHALKRTFDETTMRHAITRNGGETLDFTKIEAAIRSK